MSLIVIILALSLDDLEQDADMELDDDHDRTGGDDHTCHGTRCSLSWEYDLSVSSGERPEVPVWAPGHCNTGADEHRHARKN